MMYRRFVLLGCPVQSFGTTTGTVLAVYDNDEVPVADLLRTRGDNPPQSIMYWVQEVWTGDPRTFDLPPFGAANAVSETGLQIIRRDPGQLSTVVLTDVQMQAFETVRAVMVDIADKESEMLGTGAQMMLTALDNFASSFIEPRPR